MVQTITSDRNFAIPNKSLDGRNATSTIIFTGLHSSEVQIICDADTHIDVHFYLTFERFIVRPENTRKTISIVNAAPIIANRNQSCMGEL